MIRQTLALLALFASFASPALAGPIRNVEAARKQGVVVDAAKRSLAELSQDEGQLRKTLDVHTAELGSIGWAKVSKGIFAARAAEVLKGEAISDRFYLKLGQTDATVLRRLAESQKQSAFANSSRLEAASKALAAKPDRTAADEVELKNLGARLQESYRAFETANRNLQIVDADSFHADEQLRGQDLAKLSPSQLKELGHQVDHDFRLTRLNQKIVSDALLQKMAE